MLNEASPSPLNTLQSPRSDPRERNPWLATVVVAAILCSAVILLLAVVHLPQHAPESLSIRSGGSTDCGWGPNLTATHGGTFEFSGVANDSSSLTLIVMTPSFIGIFTGHGEAGSGSVSVAGGAVYLFNLCSVSAVTIQVAGTLSFETPLL